LENIDITYSCAITQVQPENFQNSQIQNPFNYLRKDQGIYPISLERISGRKNPRNLPKCYFDVDGKYLLTVNDLTDPNNVEYAKTFQAAKNFDSKLLKFQIDCTGSDHEWIDIVLGYPLTTTYNGEMVTFEQWPSILNKKTWTDIIGIDFRQIPKTPKIGIDNIMTVTILHEYFHTIAVSTPTGISLLIYYVFSLYANNRI